jgi:2-polyprenyl-6-methoxyphenol hydroxylase-like FAD-dependent oxidoreductase
MARFYRVHLHEFLISQIPAERLHLNKRVVGVNTLEDGVRVTFQDGSEWIGDAVIAADGIHSAVRQAFYPDYKLLTGDHVTLREVFPTNRLEGIEGIPKESCHYPGPDRGMFISYLSECTGTRAS